MRLELCRILMRQLYSEQYTPDGPLADHKQANLKEHRDREPAPLTPD